MYIVHVRMENELTEWNGWQKEGSIYKIYEMYVRIIHVRSWCEWIMNSKMVFAYLKMCRPTRCAPHFQSQIYFEIFHEEKKKTMTDAFLESPVQSSISHSHYMAMVRNDSVCLQILWLLQRDRELIGRARENKRHDEIFRDFTITKVNIYH